jgi:hypothetical protein
MTDPADTCARQPSLLSSLKQYQWRNRVLVISAENVDDNNLLEQAAELALTPDEFADRDMVLVMLLDNSVSKAGDRQLTSAEVTAVRAPLGDLCPDRFDADAAKRKFQKVAWFQLV